jgi:short-subunit dehydrogenase
MYHLKPPLSTMYEIGIAMIESQQQARRPVALVTGASSGIGRSLAELLAARGHDLVLTARRLPLLEQAAQEIENKSGARCVVIACDLAAPDGASQLIAEVRRQKIPIDYLVNNAGVTVEGRFLDHDWERQRAFVQLMSTAPAELIHAFLPDMLSAGTGKILNVASLGAFWPCFPGITLYAGAKSFLLRLTHTLAVEYADSGVTFTVLCPFTARTAFIDTPSTRGIVEKMPAFMIQSPEKVALIGIDAVEKKRVVAHTSALNHALAIGLTTLPPRLIAMGITRFMALGQR